MDRQPNQYQDNIESNKANFVGVKKFSPTLDTGPMDIILSKYTRIRHLLEFRMAFITRSELEKYSHKYDIRKSIKLAEATYHTRIFLSHSHKDRSLVNAIRGWLAENGVQAYVDWLDEDMPKEICPQTAHRIREKISESDKFLLLATEHSLNSKWVPWELGCADGIKSAENIAVLTVRENGRDFPGNEYLNLYPRIGEGEKGVGVFPAGQTSGKTLEAWMNASRPFSSGKSKIGLGHLYS